MSESGQLGRLPTARQIRDLYEILFEHYGPQGWWPVVSRACEPGYDARGYHRGLYPRGREDMSAFFDVVCGAVLTQNTAWKNAEAALIEMRRRRFDTFEKIISARTEDLAEAVRSSGYYNQKAKKLKFLSEVLRNLLPSSSGRGISEELSIESSEILRERLLDVWGLGPETVDSILLYAYDLPFFVIDAYTRRLLGRVFYSTGISELRRGYDVLQKIFHRSLSGSTVIYGEYHALLVRHCKESCTVRPHCIGCILNKQCLFYHGSDT
jgi:endonuclease-3 related protein